MKIAVDAREREVVKVIGTTVFLADDVRYVELQAVNRPDATDSIRSDC